MKEEYTKEKGLYYCGYPHCNYKSKFLTGNHDNAGISMHAEWHREVKRANIPHLYEEGDQTVCKYPCPEESCRFTTPFSHYKAYLEHKERHHPDFIWKCRYPACDYSNSSRSLLNLHVSRSHKRGRYCISVLVR